MIKKRRLLAAFTFVFLFLPHFLVTQSETVSTQEHVQQPDVSVELFEAPQDIEGLDIVIHIPTMRQKISVRDLPFYTKLFCSYVYEEKIKKWYQVAGAYVGGQATEKK